MNEVIDKLISIDKKARSMVDEAENYRAAVLSGLEQEVAEFKKSYIQKAERRIGIVKEEESKVSGQAVMDATSHVKSLMENLEMLYEQKHQEWEDSLYKRCIGG